MMQLCRIAYTDMGTFGRLMAAGGVWMTVERPWAGNKPNVSCVPEGVYAIRKDYYHRGGYPAFELTDVPFRSEIKIHIGNTMDDVSGCVALGMDFGYINKKWAVVQSRVAFNQFMAATDHIQDSLIRIYQYQPQEYKI